MTALAVASSPGRLGGHSCRSASGARLEAFSSALVARGHEITPLIEADPRDRQQMLDALSVLASLLSLQSQTL